MTTVTLPWPDRVLHPNVRSHHMAKAKVAKAVREQAFWTAFNAEASELPRVGEIMVSIDFYPPDNRRRDLDGMLSASKNQLDGIADALKIDDSRFALTIRKHAATPHGKVVVTIGAPQ